MGEMANNTFTGPVVNEPGGSDNSGSDVRGKGFSLSNFHTADDPWINCGLKLLFHRIGIAIIT